MNKQEIKKFIVDTLLPYKQDPSNCGYDENDGCVYLTSDNKKCAVGKHMVEGEWQQATVDSMENEGFNWAGVSSVFQKWGWEKVLTEEAKKFHVALGVHASKIWDEMQSYHDAIAIGRFRTSNIHSIERLLEIELTELK